MPVVKLHCRKYVFETPNEVNYRRSLLFHLHPAFKKMNRRNKKFSVGKFLKWVLIITLVIAAIEIPIIYFFARPDKPAAATVAVSGEEKVIEQNAPANVSPAAEMPVQAQPIQNSPIEKDTIIEPPVVEKVPEPKAKPDTKKVAMPDIPKLKPERVEKAEWTDATRQQVLSQLNARRDALGGKTKCVKIRQTATSNVSNGFKIAEYLKQNGYFISGRETVSRKVKGAEVSTAGECLVVTIGTF